MLETSHSRTSDIQPARVSPEAKASNTSQLYAKRLCLPERRKETIENIQRTERAESRTELPTEGRCAADRDAMSCQQSDHFLQVAVMVVFQFPQSFSDRITRQDNRSFCISNSTIAIIWGPPSFHVDWQTWAILACTRRRFKR
jgi:hypothetical protein